MDLCDWKGLDQECMQLIVAIREGRAAANPFTFLAFSSSASDQRKSAENCAAYCVSAKRLWRGDRYCHERIRLAYVSADLREHAVSYLLADLFERHDRSRFETFAISLANAPSPMRERLERAFDHFIDVEQKNDEEVAAMLREMEIDIVVDLMGYTRNAHPAIFAMRPAPIQVCYLGYPGTSGADFFDYFIGDKIVLPFDQQPYFTEKIVHLPDCFMPAYSKRAVACEVPARADSGLPEEAFVFCSFNAGYKINAPMFDIWMRLLRDVEGSVLWLLHSNDIATANLRREAQARGVAGHRLIFASPAVLAEHLARISLADLFLNTHPVNAGSNAIDALSVGLPIVTYAGETFVQRVTASLLHAVGLSELVAPSLADYEALALQLARNPAILAQIKAKLARNRETYPLFDIERFTRHLEAAYTTMWEIWQRGEAPKSFAVEPMASSRKGGNTLNGV
jgi:predicted O-linked N-acetylglucosamine transferase (SPINDLY family)